MIIGGIVGGADGGPFGPPPEHCCALRWRPVQLNFEGIDSPSLTSSRAILPSLQKSDIQYRQQCFQFKEKSARHHYCVAPAAALALGPGGRPLIPTKLPFVARRWPAQMPATKVQSCPTA